MSQVWRPIVGGHKSGDQGTEYGIFRAGGGHTSSAQHYQHLPGYIPDRGISGHKAAIASHNQHVGGAAEPPLKKPSNGDDDVWSGPDSMDIDEDEVSAQALASMGFEGGSVDVPPQPFKHALSSTCHYYYPGRIRYYKHRVH